MKTKKSTRKFIQNRLKSVIETRKKHKATMSKRRVKSKPNPGDNKGQRAADNDDPEFSSSDNESDQMSDGQTEQDTLMQWSDSEAEEEDQVPSGLDEDEVSHKNQLDKLKTLDPEFYKFLQENDQELLNFDDSDGEADMEGSKEVENDEQAEQEEKEEGEEQITQSMIDGWKESLQKTHSIKTLRKLIAALRSAAAIGDENDQAPLMYMVEEGEGIVIAWDSCRLLLRTLYLHVFPMTVFSSILLTCIEVVPSVFHHHLGSTATKSGKAQLPSSSPKWRKLQPLVKSFLANLLRLLTQLTDADMLAPLIRGSQSIVSYYVCFPKLGKEFVRQLLHYWSSGDESVRVAAFLSLRQMAMDAPQSYLDRILKGAYKVYTQVSKNTSVHTWTNLSFMSQCVIELGGLHLMTTYQHGFVAIRELALLLRAAVNSQTKDSFKAVYCWPFLHRLKLWSTMIGTYSKEESSGQETLKHLVYPLVQVSIGVMRLKPSSKHFPMRFQIIRMLVDLGSKMGTFIPLSSYLFEVFDSAEVSAKAKPSTLKPLDMSLTLRAPNGYLSSKVYQSSLIDESVSLLYDIYAALALDVAFPELIVPAVIHMKRWIKKSKNFMATKQMQLFIEKVELDFLWYHTSNI